MLYANSNPKPVTPGVYDVVAAFYGSNSSSKYAPTGLYGIDKINIILDLEGGYGVGGIDVKPGRHSTSFIDTATKLRVTIISRTQVKVERP